MLLFFFLLYFLTLLFAVETVGEEKLQFWKISTYWMTAVVTLLLWFLMFKWSQSLLKPKAIQVILNFLTGSLMSENWETVNFQSCFERCALGTSKELQSACFQEIGTSWSGKPCISAPQPTHRKRTWILWHLSWREVNSRFPGDRLVSWNPD